VTASPPREKGKGPKSILLNYDKPLDGCPPRSHIFFRLLTLVLNPRAKFGLDGHAVPIIKHSTAANLAAQGALHRERPRQTRVRVGSQGSATAKPQPAPARAAWWGHRGWHPADSALNAALSLNALRLNALQD
jgi:hypothetical protein